MKSNEFLLVFWKGHKTNELQPSAVMLKRHLKYWHEWVISLAVNDLLASQLRRWDTGGRVLKPDRSIIEGPFKENNELIAGLITIYANDYQEANEIALGCPILDLGGTVEIRMAVSNSLNVISNY
ncbi:YciI family protein [Mucilaginibacter sabulilitoris]|uniref:YciI family protein n=1 Tax=Mucilaginibacter sabulilitoris TaxID=1173583 RepID=A0ABZ0TD77_9SPHI|nr:YciI family protein [Mucilaginibacter sabulilitoris]WPU90928.1 YciI family protein [Mucilaginibacter sabulilitoris]